MNNVNALQAQAVALLRSRSFGVLATNSIQLPGTPSASIVTYALDPETRPIFLLSSLALHTKNLREDPHSSLLVFDAGTETAPLTSGRLNLFGVVREVSEGESGATRELYVSRHPDASLWAGFGDFSFCRMMIARAYFIGGFGVMGWIDGRDLLELA